MLSQTLQDAFNEQMKYEFFSAYLYKAMAAYFEAEDLAGFAVWMRSQSLEELTHGEKFFNFICEAGGRAIMQEIEAPRVEYASPLEVFEYSLEHERFVTERINKLMDLSRDESNHAAQIFLQWFVTEQVEEESTFSLACKKLKLVDGDGRGLLMLDQEFGTRTFTAPAGFTLLGA
jgi:ferritin